MKLIKRIIDEAYDQQSAVNVEEIFENGRL